MQNTLSCKDRYMLIFAIETSCDETAVAVMRNGRETLSSELFSQADMHAMYGGVVPEIASRNHAAIIGRLSELALKNAGITKNDIDAVASRNDCAYKRRLKLRESDIVCGDMSPDMMHGNKRHIKRHCQALGKTYTNEKGADKPRRIRHSNSVNIFL